MHLQLLNRSMKQDVLQILRPFLESYYPKYCNANLFGKLFISNLLDVALFQLVFYNSHLTSV